MATPELTIFSIPEPFTERIRKSRKNAISSWRRLQPRAEILLFGGDDEVAAYVAGTDIRHVPDVARSELGTPLLSDVFARAQQIATGRTLMFSNCDMLYFDELYRAIAAVPFDHYMLCGRRWDLDVPNELDPSDDTAWAAMRARYGGDGRLHSPSGLDFFIFPRTLRIEMPPLVVGRPGWDSWFMWYLRSRRIPVIDGTGGIAALHQNHDYNHLKHGAAQYRGLEMQINCRLAGGYAHMLGLREADWIIADGRVVRPAWPRRMFSLLGPSWPYRHALKLRRQLLDVLRR